jgi:hypothetical protein
MPSANLISTDRELDAIGHRLSISASGAAAGSPRKEAAAISNRILAAIIHLMELLG